MSDINQGSDAAMADESSAPAPQGIRLAVSAAPQINFAFQQNAVPVIREIELINYDPASYRDLTLEMRAAPAFLAAKQWRIDQVLAGGRLHINERDTQLNGQYLINLHESIRGELTFTMRNSNGATLAEQVIKLEVLARNEWGGYGSSPELLAAFCMPNERAVDKLLRKASDVLRSNGHDGVLLAYDKADAKRIWLQTAAVWNVLLALRLDYAYPPASFEATGQKIRTPGAILESSRATCLDTTFLLAALCEQMGLNPLIILERGHAYFGLWLKKDGFARPFTDDVLALRKRVQLKEIILIETTLVCQRADFKTALKHAEEHLLKDDSAVVGILDIARARDERIRPLSFASGPGEQTAIPDVDTSATLELQQPDDLKLGGEAVEWGDATAGPAGRLGQWQRKLLDLSLRNPLLNMRASKTNIPLIAPNPALLEDLLAQGKSLAIEAVPVHANRDQDIHTQRTGNNLDEEIALSALARNKLYVHLEQDKLDSALIELYRKARNDLEEGGANTLFLAIGILYWQRPGVAERTYRAPLILIPVTVTRQSVRSGIKLTINDDEPRFNTTLLEMLRQDFAHDIKGLDGPLPTDENGTDIPAILTRIRQEIKDVAGFDVRNEVFLGTFSFAKYLMWKDLVDRTDKLKDNAVVRHLIETPREHFNEVQKFVDPKQLDELIDPALLFTPLHADSSQLAAVVSSAEGKNFVMIGPPGTGKSQTIANMIAHNLGLGRTVLFVSEKAAALDVVYRRLREQGLGEFCLELHSNKAKKLDVLRQLGEAWQVSGKLSEAIWRKETSSLKSVRDQLNQFVKMLHSEHRNGLTVRTALSLAAGSSTIPGIKLSWASVDQHDRKAHEQLLAVGERIDINAAEVGDLNNHPLSLIHHTDWSMSWQQGLLEQNAELLSDTQLYQQEVKTLAQRLGVNADVFTPEQLAALTKLAQTLRQVAGQDVSFAFLPTASALLDTIDQALSKLKAFEQNTAQLSCGYNRELMLGADLTPAKVAWQKAEASWWLPRIIHGYSCRQYLKKNLGAVASPDPKNDLPVLAELQKMYKELQAITPQLEKIPGWRLLDSDVLVVAKVTHLAKQLRHSISTLASDPEQLLNLRSEVRKLAVDANDMLGDDGVVGRQLRNYLARESAFQQSLINFSNLARQTPVAVLATANTLENLINFLTGINTAAPRLNAWCAWRRARDEAVDLGLQSIVMAIEDNKLQPGVVRRCIQVNYARWWAAAMVDSTPILRQFVSAEHEQKIINFRELDSQIRRITADYIRTRVREGLLEKEEVKRSSEFGMIRRELEKKTRHKPLRQLISEAPNAIPMLTPCLLMSPLSIAQYLPVEQQLFDLVIFDEASQITVWDAIGAIARGKQTVMVGDPKQLPPTSFFSSSQSAEDELEEEEDLESILDEMLGANLPTMNLSWHYRSRHESLITFSNHRYYKGGLVTFPSPVTNDTAVSMEYVGGVYDRGGDQTNRAEAEAIVEEIKRRCNDPQYANLTVGVVTFNQKQQTLILDLLEAARRDSPELDKRFAEDLIEPIFVKNLESVQGDERDIILFSITFGADNSGNITMNFGPLNKNGGERRLNVAITRARTELKVFSSLRSEQIDLTRTAANGVRDLKHFLEFAEKGVKALGEIEAATKGSFDSPLEIAVAQDLRAKGWTLQPQVGVSRFRVDLAVVDPDSPEQFLAGIECDGATYQSSATARDRDLVRESVLRGLGWNIVRLWSTDYWLDPKGVVEKIDAQLRSFLEKRRKSNNPLKN